jgi:hypothetical protein
LSGGGEGDNLALSNVSLSAALSVIRGVRVDYLLFLQEQIKGIIIKTSGSPTHSAVVDDQDIAHA